MNKLKFVIDTNIIISAFLFKNSNPRKALELAKNHHLILLSSNVIQEIKTVIKRPKFDRYISLTAREEFLDTLIRSSLTIDPDEIITECRDPKDNKYLELAVAGKAECIITGDQDLLILNPFREIPIMTVQEFLTIYEKFTE